MNVQRGEPAQGHGERVEAASGLTPEQARSGHCTRGGTIVSGKAVCQCGAWTAADGPGTRKEHLAEVLRVRLAAGVR